MSRNWRNKQNESFDGATTFEYLTYLVRLKHYMTKYEDNVDLASSIAYSYDDLTIALIDDFNSKYIVNFLTSEIIVIHKIIDHRSAHTPVARLSLREFLRRIDRFLFHDCTLYDRGIAIPNGKRENFDPVLTRSEQRAWPLNDKRRWNDSSLVCESEYCFRDY